MVGKLHDILRDARHARQMTLMEVGAKVNCTAMYLSGVETGKKPIAVGRVLESLCALYSLDYPAICHASLDEKLIKLADAKKTETDLFWDKA